MFRYITSLLLIGISAAILFLFSNPLYQEIGKLKAEQVTYNEALGNSKALENERDRLVTDYDAISVKDKEKITRMVPDNVDNIRLILEIEDKARPYSMALKDVQYNATPTDSKNSETKGASVITGGGSDRGKNKIENYGSWDLGFSVTTNYNNFLNFVRDLEKNLRIIDISSVQFTSASGPATSGTPQEIYRFNFKIKTYWLKN